MNRYLEITRTFFLFTALFALLPAAGAAQMQPVVYGGSEWAFEEDLNVQYLGVTLQPADLRGWGPVFSVLGLRIESPGPTGDVDAFAVLPQIGIRHGWAVGGVQATAGWFFIQDQEESPVVPVAGGSESGFHLGAQGDYWGDRGQWDLQGLASFNFGDDFFLSRLRAARRVATVGQGGILLGAEAGYQDGNNYSASFGGGIAEWQIVPAFKILGGVGYREPSPGDGGAYVRGEFVILP